MNILRVWYKMNIFLRDFDVTRKDPPSKPANNRSKVKFIILVTCEKNPFMEKFHINLSSVFFKNCKINDRSHVNWILLMCPKWEKYLQMSWNRAQHPLIPPSDSAPSTRQSALRNWSPIIPSRFCWSTGRAARAGKRPLCRKRVSSFCTPVRDYNYWASNRNNP